MKVKRGNGHWVTISIAFSFFPLRLVSQSFVCSVAFVVIVGGTASLGCTRTLGRGERGTRGARRLTPHRTNAKTPDGTACSGAFRLLQCCQRVGAPRDARLGEKDRYPFVPPAPSVSNVVLSAPRFSPLTTNRPRAGREKNLSGPRE